MFPQLHVQPSTECTRTDTLHSDPFLFFDRICHKTQSQTNLHPSIDRHSRHRKPPPPSICLLGTCALTPSPIEAVGPLPLLLGGACPILRVGARRQFLHRSNICVGLARNPNWGVDVGVGAGGAGYWVIVCMGPCSTVVKLSPLQRIPRRRRARRKIGRGTRSMNRRSRAHWIAYLLLRGG